MIYFITRHPFPEGMAGTNRIKCYVRALHNEGVPCLILIYARDGEGGVADGMVGGVPYHYMLGCAHRWKGVLAKGQTLLMMAALYLRLFFFLSRDDVVFEYAREDYKFIRRIIQLVHLKGAKFVSELCEIPGLGFTHANAVKEKQYIEKELFPHYDGVVAISGSLVEYARQHASSRCRMIEVPVLVDARRFCGANLAPRPVEEPYIFYSGSFDDQKDGTIVMFDAFAKVARAYTGPLQFVCTGTKEAALSVGYLSKYIQSPELSERLRFTAYLSQAQIVRYLSHCEIIVSSRYTNEQTKNGFSTKLAEYAAAGKAIVLTPVGEARKWFHDGEDCSMVPEHDSEALSKEILALLNDRPRREELGRGARQMSMKSFDYAVWGSTLKFFF